HPYGRSPLSRGPRGLDLFLPVRRMLVATRAELPEIQTARIVPLILRRGIGLFLALGARQVQLDTVFGLRHLSGLPSQPRQIPRCRDALPRPPMGFEPMTPILPRWCATTAPQRQAAVTIEPVPPTGSR